MTLDDVAAPVLRVAVGHTREDAAACFGSEHDDVLLTTYAELGSEVDLAQGQALDLVPGTDFAEAFDAASQRLRDGSSFVLRVAAPVGGSLALASDLERASLQIAQVLDTGHAVLLELEPRTTTTPAQDRLVLTALDAASGPQQQDAAAEVPGPAPTAGTTPAPERPAPPARPDPRLLDVLGEVTRWRQGPRRRLAALGGLVAAVVVLVLIGVWTYHAGSLLAVAVPALLVLSLATTAVVCYFVLLLARQVHVQTGRIERMVLRNREVVQNRTRNIGQRVQKLENTRLPHVINYLQSVAESTSSTAARVRTLTHSLDSNGFASPAHARAQRTLHLETQRQVQALLALQRVVDLPDHLPPMGGWAASPDFNLLILQELLAVRPRTVVECGSGTSTLLMALAVRKHGLSTRIVTLEHLEQFRDLTLRALEESGVADLVDLRLAPLHTTSVPDHATPWYDEHALADVHDVGLLLVDGPPETTGERARYPAVPLLRDRFAERVSIVVDDLIRPADRETVEAWHAQLGEDFAFEHVTDLQKHAGVLRRSAAQTVERPRPSQ